MSEEKVRFLKPSLSKEDRILLKHREDLLNEMLKVNKKGVVKIDYKSPFLIMLDYI